MGEKGVEYLENILNIKYKHFILGQRQNMGA